MVLDKTLIMKILVLGSSGQIGSPTCDYLRDNGHKVVEWDIINGSDQDLRLGNYDLYDVMRDCDFVFYFASDVGGAKYLEKYQDSYQFIMNNIDIMKFTFTALKDTGTPFLFTSSQMAELHNSTYGLLKLIGEKLTCDIGGLVVRLWNVYGEEHDAEKSHVITDFIDMAKKDKKIVMRTDGKESRQLLYVEDCVECFLTLMNLYDTLDKTKNYHITNFEWITIKEIAEIVAEISGASIEVGLNKDNTQMNAMNEADDYILNFWKPKTSIKNGIEKIYFNL